MTSPPSFFQPTDSSLTFPAPSEYIQCKKKTKSLAIIYSLGLLFFSRSAIRRDTCTHSIKNDRDHMPILHRLKHNPVHALQGRGPKRVLGTRAAVQDHRRFVGRTRTRCG